MGGYDANFNPPLDDKYKCPVCLTALRDPIQTKCGHRLCSTCFKQIRGGNWYFRCPVDNTWSNHVFEDNAVKREVLSLQTNCDNKKCPWCGELRELQTHLKSCDYELVHCPNKCTNTPEIMRLDLDKHMDECPHRMETCKHCSIQVLVTQLARHHVLMCPKFPVNCPVCGEAEIIRENMNSHTNIINGDCPMVIVPCCFRHIGCMHQDKRAKMPQHYIDNHTHHLMLLSTRLVDMETKHRIDLQACKKGLEMNVSELCEKYQELEKRYVLLETELHENKLKLTSLTTLYTNVAHSNQLRTQSPQQCDLFTWSIDMSVKRKAHYSPTYSLSNTTYKIHLWLQPEIQLLNNEHYSTICVILERCENENELPVQFDCCFLVVTSDESTRAQLKTYVTTDVFNLSGHVSKPMTLFKSQELLAHVASTDNKLNIQFTLNALRETSRQ